MQFSTEALNNLVGRASLIPEQMETAFEAGSADDQAERRLARWQQVAARGDAADFARRLARDGLTVEAVRPLLGAVRPAALSPLPPWAETLQAALGHTLTDDDCRSLTAAAPVPFEELLLPFVAVARRRLQSEAGPAYAILAEKAQISLERSLLERLGQLGLKTFAFEFSLFRMGRQAGGWSGLLGAAPGQELYHAFVEAMQGGQLATLLEKYSLLARLLAAVADGWAAGQATFLRRLAADRPALQALLQPEGPDLGPVARLRAGLSDPHQGGQTAVGLEFACGQRVIYKPRTLGLERTYFDLLGWLNAQGAPLPFKQAAVLNRDAYGWMEYVAAQPCASEAELERYYRRSGMLLALLHVLHATDCHLENIIACGEQPVLIDAETLAIPRPRQEGLNAEQAVQGLDQTALHYSVLRVGLLPNWLVLPGQNEAVDVGALATVERQEVDSPPMWQHLNTDGMELGRGKIGIGVQTNRPFADSGDPQNYVAEVVVGFEQMYRFLVRRRAALLAPNGPLAALARQSGRYIMRGTNSYFNIAYKALNPKFLRDGADWSIQLDFLSRAALGWDAALWPIQRSEWRAMLRLDIPYFSTRTDSPDLLDEAGPVVKDYFAQPGYDSVLARLAGLDETDLARQVEIIRASYCARFTDEPAAAGPVEATAPAPSNAALIEQAARIAAELERRATPLPGDNDGVYWVGLNYAVEIQRFHLSVFAPDLYNGAGIALFLGGLEKVRGVGDYRALALAAAYGLSRFTRQRLDIPPVTAPNLWGEIGAVVYVLTRLSEWLAEPALLDEARTLADRITPEALAGDARLVSGAVGALLGLLALHSQTDRPERLAQALACGQYLLARRADADPGGPSWPTLPPGLAYGVDGAAYALWRLAAHDPAFGAAALAGVQNNQAPRREAVVWGNGPVETGLARLGMLTARDEPAIRTEFEQAVQAIRTGPPLGLDHLCGGNFGRLELLLSAAQYGGCPELWPVVTAETGRVLAQVESGGAFRLFGGPVGNVYNAGFGRGMAGIGYQLLRLAAPEALPPALLWW